MISHGQKPYKSAENYLGRRKSNRNTGEPQVLRQWTILKVYRYYHRV